MSINFLYIIEIFNIGCVAKSFFFHSCLFILVGWIYNLIKKSYTKKKKKLNICDRKRIIFIDPMNRKYFIYLSRHLMPHRYYQFLFFNLIMEKIIHEQKKKCRGNYILKELDAMSEYESILFENNSILSFTCFTITYFILLIVVKKKMKERKS
jgi:hypothetical protein